jgi:uncharacterized integral membrane protein (TIGR00698 family)
MSHVAVSATRALSHPLQARSWWLGIALAGAIAVAGIAVAHTAWAQYLGLSALTLAIVFGILAGNSFFPAIAARTAPGVDFSKSTLLRAGIILFGLRITFQQIAAVGWAGVVIDALMVALTFVIAVQLGTRLLGMDRETSMLIGAGSALCGAAAVMATEPVVRGQAHKVSVAVATVVVFGTLGMFAYPFLYPYLGMSEHAYGVFTGSTVHEVAQVVAAGRSVSEPAAAAAVIEKMLRIMMLAPFLLVLSGTQRDRAGAVAAEGHTVSRRPIVVPWFAVLFIVASAVNSLQLLPAGLVAALIDVDTVLLATAMAALGLRTHVGAIRQAGARPLLLAAVLFAFLVLGGYVINRLVAHLLG